MDRKLIHKRLVQDTLHLIVGETTRQIPCPYCRKAEGGFSVSRVEEGLLYNCFHASCHEHGFIPTNPQSSPDSVEPKEAPSTRTTKEFKYNTVALTHDQHIILNKKYPSVSKTAQLNEQWRWCPEQGRLVMPIFNQNRQRIGVVARYLKELQDGVIPYDIQSKSLIYWEKEYSLHLHFPLWDNTYKKDKDGELIYVVVEDIPSAIAIQSLGYRSIALLGTNIPKDCVNWFYNKNVVFVFDNDATHIALKYQSRYNILFKDCQVLHLPMGKDPKDMTPKEIGDEIYAKIHVGT